MKQIILLKNLSRTRNEHKMFASKSIYILLLLLMFYSYGNAASRFAVTNGNWGDAIWALTANGSAGSASTPTSSEDVTINGGVTVTIDASGAACLSLAINPSNTGSTGILSFGSSGVLTVSGNITIGGSGTRKGSIIMSSGGHLKLSGSFTVTNLNTFTPGSGTIEYNAGGAQTVATTANLVNAYNNLTLSGTSGGSNIKTVTGVTVNGTLTMEGNATVNTAPTYGSSAGLKYSTTMTPGSEWISPFVATGGVIINSGTVTLNAAKTFNSGVSLSINSGATLVTSNFSLTLGGNFTIASTGTFTGGSSAITFGAAFTNNGTISSGGSFSVTINCSSSNNIGGFTTTGNVTATNSGTVTFTGNVIAGGLIIDNGTGSGTLNLGTGLTHTFTGNLTRTSGTLNCGTSTLKLGSAVSGTATFTAGTGSTVEWNASTDQTIAAIAYYNLILSGSGTKTLTSVSTINGNLTLGGTVTATTAANFSIGGNLTVGSGTTFTVADYNLTVTGTTTIVGSLSFSSGTSGTKTFNSLVSISSTGSWSNTNSPVTFKNGITNSGIFTAGSGTHTFSTNSQTLTGTFSIDNITVTGVTLTNSGELTANSLSGTGGLTQATNSTLHLSDTYGITTLTLNASGNTVNFSGTSQTVPAIEYYHLDLTGATGTLFPNGTVGIIGTFNPAGASAPTTGTINFKGSGQTIPAFSYNNLNLTNATSISFPSGTIGISGTFTTGTTSSASSTGTVDFNGGSTQTIPAFQYNNLIISGGNTKTLGGAITIDGSLTISGSSTTLSASGNNYGITIKGNWVCEGTFTGQSGTVTFNSSTASQTIGGSATSQTFANITVNKSGQTLSVASSTTTLTLSGNLTLTAGTFDAGTATTINVAGNWTNNSSSSAFVTGSGTVTLNGGSQTLGGSATTNFYNLNVEGSADKNLQKDIQVENTLTLTTKNIVTGTNILTANNIVRNTTGHIVGNLKKSFSSGTTSRTFEIGTTGYNPTAVNFTSVSSSGYLTVAAIGDQHSAISNINANKNINLYWKLTKDGTLAFSNCGITFQYSSNDIDAGSNVSEFIVGRYEAAYWSYPAISGTPTASTTTVTGITSFGDFQIGQSLIPASSEGLEEIYWTDLWGTAVSSNVLVKTATTTAWDAGAASENFLLPQMGADSDPAEDGFVKFIVPDAASLEDVKAFGLSDNNTTNHYTSIDYCFLLDNDELTIYENGQPQGSAGSLEIGDVLIIERVDGLIYYIKNGIVVDYNSEKNTGVLIVDAAIYNEGGAFDGLTCSFKFYEFIAEATIENQTTAALGSISLNFVSGYPLYETIWRGVRYPGEAFLDTIIDSLETYFFPINDGGLGSLFESLKYDDDLSDVASCRDTVIVIDSLEDVHKLVYTVGKEIEWLNTDGLDITSVSIDKWKQGEVTFYYGEGVKVNKNVSDGWNTGYAVSNNIFGMDENFFIEFSVPQILAELAVGLKPAINGFNVNNLSSLQIGFLFDNKNEFRVIERGVVLYSGEYNAGDVFSINRVFDSKTLRETFTYTQNAQEIAETDPQSNNQPGYNTYRLGINVFTTGASVINIIVTGSNLQELNANMIEPSLCMPTGKILLNLGNLPLDNSLSYNFSYLWSTGDETPYIFNIPQGAYTATVTAISSDSDTVVFTRSFILPAKVRWKELINTSVEDPMHYNSIVKDEGGDDWNAFATSRNYLPKLVEGYTQFKSGVANNYVFGLTQFDLEAPKVNYGVVLATFYEDDFTQFPIRILMATYLDLDESPEATLLGVYRAGDEFRIEKTLSQVSLWKNTDESSLFVYPDYLDENFFVKAFIFKENNIIKKSVATFDCGEMFSYSTLKSKPDASYYEVKDNKLRFVYTEEYAEGTLNYKIYDSERNEVAISGCAPNSNLLKQVGYNNYEIDFSSCSLDNGYYTLEILGEKKQFYTLRFKI